MMRRNCTNVIKFSSMAAKSAHISVMLNVRMELLEARFEARSKRAPSHQLPRLLPETPGDEQPHLLHVTHILPPFFFATKLTFVLHVREFKKQPDVSLLSCMMVTYITLLSFTEIVQQGELQELKQNWQNSSFWQPFPFFPFEDN